VRPTAKGVLPSRLLLPRNIIKSDAKGLSMYIELNNTGIFGSKGNDWHTFHTVIFHTLQVLEKVNACVRA